jgi:hypothetical protein
MTLAIHKARSEPGSATYVLVTYAALLALVRLLVREFAGHPRGVKAAVWVPSTLLTEMVGRLEGVVQTGCVVVCFGTIGFGSCYLCSSAYIQRQYIYVPAIYTRPW